MKAGTYKEYPKKVRVLSEYVSWEKEYITYTPPIFTAPHVLEGPKWADPQDIQDVKKEWKSFEGELLFDKEGYPLNPKGRIGIAGRGVLGKWGPNFAVDAIVTKHDAQHNIQMIVIQRKDTMQFAIPGGMIDEGEEVHEAASRELLEETGVDLNMEHTVIVYRGYVDDPRNTDNAWIETTVLWKHMYAQENDFMIQGGDDAFSASWHVIDKKLLSAMYANHADFVKMILKKAKTT